MNIHDYKIWGNPTPKSIDIISRKNLNQPQWLTPEIVNYTIDWIQKQWEDVPRSNNTDVVAVLPISEDNEILLIEERRIPFITDTNEGRVIWLPAGLVDAQEDINHAVLREMQEEIWYSSSDIEFFTRVTSSEWMTNEEVNIFIARNCKKVTELIDGYKKVWGLFIKHEEAELIDAIYSIPYEDIDNFLETAQSQWIRRGSKLDVGLRAYERDI